jgi:hypothetical protein
LTRTLAAAALAAVALVLAAPVALADSSYADSVARAYTLVEQARDGSPTAARQALAELRSGTGDSQPEVIADLSHDPPDLDDAAARLRALSTALEAPADTADPATAHARLTSILAQSRYGALRAGQNPLDRLLNWIVDQLARLLAGATLPRIPYLEQGLLLLGVLLVAGVAGWLLLSLRGRALGDSVSPRLGDGGRPFVDHFAEADRLAAAGDHTLAVRELAAGVAARLGGDAAWDLSPLTVRELFARAASPQQLRPLLHAFERAAYAGLPADKRAYEDAAAAAAPFRGPEVRAA